MLKRSSSVPRNSAPFRGRAERRFRLQSQPVETTRNHLAVSRSRAVGWLVMRKHRAIQFLAALLALTSPLLAHAIGFNSTITYSSTQPAGGADSVANWTGAAFDAAGFYMP